MNSLERKIKDGVDQLTHGNLAAYTPSLQIGVLYKGRVKAQVHLGKNARYFDLASLTKVIFTVSEFMALESEEKLRQKDFICQHWPEFPHPRIRISDLLTHSAGFRDWAPFYKSLVKSKNPRSLLLRQLMLETRSRRRRSLYSDIDFLWLSFVLEQVRKQDLASIWQLRAQTLGLRGIHFCPNNTPVYAKTKYAPTEKCPWRRRWLQGEVHDDNTWAMGGVSTHAGLFGDLGSVIDYLKLLRGGLINSRGSALGPQTVIRGFTKRAIKKSLGDWAMGFMMPTVGKASCGRHFSSVSIGHTGFTGTSLWYDPKSDLGIVMLSNRVSPTRENIYFRSLRPKLHDLVAELVLP